MGAKFVDILVEYLGSITTTTEMILTMVGATSTFASVSLTPRRETIRTDRSAALAPGPEQRGQDWRRFRLIDLGIITRFPVDLWIVLVWISYLTWNAGRMMEPRSIGGVAIIVACAPPSSQSPSGQPGSDISSAMRAPPKLEVAESANPGKPSRVECRERVGGDGRASEAL